MDGIDTGPVEDSQPWTARQLGAKLAEIGRCAADRASDAVVEGLR